MEISEDEEEKGHKEAETKCDFQFCKMLSSDLFYEEKQGNYKSNRKQAKNHQSHLQSVFEVH